MTIIVCHGGSHLWSLIKLIVIEQYGFKSISNPLLAGGFHTQKPDTLFVPTCAHVQWVQKCHSLEGALSVF